MHGLLKRSRMYVPLKSLFEHATGLHVYRRNTPWGTELGDDLRRLNLHSAVRVVFDVGANVGQTALRFRKAFPLATIHSFEPVSKTFAALQRNVAGFDGIIPHSFAFGSTSGNRDIYLASNCELSSFYRAGSGNGAIERVTVTRIDEFCEANSISRIDLLKIDTEGHDLEVLAGAESLFARGAVVSALVEYGLSATDSKVRLEEFVEFFRSFDSRCVGLYDQQWCGSGLYYGNALFIRDDCLG